MKLKRKLLIMIMINILLLKNLIKIILQQRLKQPNLASQNDIADLLKRQILMIN